MNSVTDEFKFYKVGNINLYTNGPQRVGSTGTLLVKWIGDYIIQQFIGINGVATRWSFDHGSSWNAWSGDENQNWTVVNSYDISDNNSHSIDIPTGAYHLHVEFGSKNNNQIFGGASVDLFSAGIIGSSHPCYVPVYKDTSTLQAIIYLFFNNGKLTYQRTYGSIVLRIGVACC